MRAIGISRVPGMRIKEIIFWIILTTLVLFSFKTLNLNISTLISGIPYGVSLIMEMFPPDFSGWKQITLLSAETVAMAIWGTLLGILFSIPLGFLSAKNISPNTFVYVLSKSFVSLIRSIPEILYALVFVVSIGMGPAAGVMALMVGTVGLLSKFYAESLESIDPGPVEAVRATGAHKLGVIRHAIFPQVFPLFTGYNLYLLDHNIRVAMTIGIIGAGGLGIELFTQMRRFQYQNVSAILIIILLLVSIIDRLSAYLRKAITEGRLAEAGNRVKDISLLTALPVIAIMSLYFIPASLTEIYRGVPRILSFILRAIPPDFSELTLYLKLMFETVAIGICGTLFAIIISIPLGLLSARNITGSAVLYNTTKEITNFFRAMPELVFALVFVAVVGLGPFAGVLAISFHTAGFLGKFYAEAIENIDPKPVEAVMATGAKFPQRISHSVVPLVMPLFNSYNLFLLDRNIRASTVMGIVGAGGIGFELVMNVRLFEHQKTATIVTVILITILAVEWISSYLRKKIV